jgi:F-type H+-transporting ATPase subunit alpha
MRAQHAEELKKIVDGDWSEEVQNAVREALEAFARDFGYDLDEEGQPLEEVQAA